MSIINFDNYKDRLPTSDRGKKSSEQEFSDMDIGELTPSQLYALLYSDWEEPDSTIIINTDVSLATLQSSSRLFRQARDFLLLMQEKGPVKATATGKNLPRKFVAELMDALLTKEECKHIREWNKAVNEFDVPRINGLRVVLEVAGLIQQRKGSFYIVKKRQHLLETDNAGNLFKHLFIVFFRKFNINYMAMYGERLGSIQDGAPYTLHRLREVAGDWRKVDDQLLSEILLPFVYEALEEEIGPRSYTTPSKFLASRFLYLLADWGLIEGKYEKKKFRYPDMSACRTTPFFSRILEFAIDESGAEASASDVAANDEMLDHLASKRENRETADRVMEFAKPLIDKFAGSDSDLTDVYRYAIAFWNFCIFGKHFPERCQVAASEENLRLALTEVPFMLNDADSMNLLEFLKECWHSEFGSERRMVVEHRLIYDSDTYRLAVISEDYRIIHMED